jgi:hypothetical protein
MISMFSEGLLNLPPLPTMKWNDYYWLSSIMLTSWAGFQSRQGPYDSIDEAKISDGSTQLIVHTPDKKPHRPSTQQIAAYSHLMEQQDYITDSLLQAILSRYPTWRKEYEEDYGTEEANEVVPPIQSPEQLKNLIGLGIIHIHTVAKDGVAYVGFELGCNWEEEHGLGVMTHNGRVIDIGSVDFALEDWIARQDAEKGSTIDQA